MAIGERELEYDELVVATGSSPAIPPIDGLVDAPYWTSRDAVWAEAVPSSLVVLGGGPVGVELAQFFSRLGTSVTIVETNERLLSRIDAEAGALLGERLAGEGVDVRTGVRAVSVTAGGPGVSLDLDSGDTVAAERVLVATGRRPNVDGLGLEQLDVEVTRAASPSMAASVRVMVCGRSATSRASGS